MDEQKGNHLASGGHWQRLSALATSRRDTPAARATSRIVTGEWVFWDCDTGEPLALLSVTECGSACRGSRGAAKVAAPQMVLTFQRADAGEAEGFLFQRVNLFGAHLVMGHGDPTQEHKGQFIRAAL